MVLKPYMPTPSVDFPQRGSSGKVTIADKLSGLGQFDAWLCDLDGTLAETMALHYKAYAAVLAEHGGYLSRLDFDAHVGPPARETLPKFVGAAGLHAKNLPPFEDLHMQKKRAFDIFVASGKVAPLETAHLIHLQPPTTRIAVVTSGNRRGAIAIIAALGLADRVELLVSGDDVLHGKPDPEPYLTAAKIMGVSTDTCLVFEDHPDGIASARAAGMTVIDVATGAVYSGNALIA